MQHDPDALTLQGWWFVVKISKVEASPTGSEVRGWWPESTAQPCLLGRPAAAIWFLCQVGMTTSGFAGEQRLSTADLFVPMLEVLIRSLSESESSLSQPRLGARLAQLIAFQALASDVQGLSLFEGWTH